MSKSIFIKPIKVGLLILAVLAAIAGVFVFAKTIVRPPANLKPVDQYAILLDKECAYFDTISEFQISRVEYIKLDDKLRLYVSEGVLEPKLSDAYRQKIDATHGKQLANYGYGLLKQSSWQDSKLNELQAMLKELYADELYSGEKAATEEFVGWYSHLTNVIESYRSALALSRSTSFNGVGDASSKITKAKNYRSADYLRNNIALVNALDALPGKLAQSHYNYVSGKVNALADYTNVSKDYYTETLIDRANKALTEYKNTTIYGNNKQSVSELENRTRDYVTAAMRYYSE